MPKKRSAIRWLELVAVLAVVVVAVLLVLPYVKYTFFPNAPTTCVANLQQWGTVFSMYRTENMFAMPLVQGYQPFGLAENAEGCLNVHDEFCFSPDTAQIFPDYSNNPLILVCPDGPYLSPPTKVGPVVTRPWRPNEQAFGVLENEGLWSCDYAGAITNADASYTYFGWRIEPRNDSDRYIDSKQAADLHLPVSGPTSVVGLLSYLMVPPGGTVKDVQDRRAVSPKLEDCLPGLKPELLAHAGSASSDSLLRMFMGFRFGEVYNPDGKPISPKDPTQKPPDRPYYATTPVMWDTIYQDSAGQPRFAHQNPDGLNVLYMDGHVEFVKYPGPFPASKDFATMKAVPSQ